VCCAAAGNAISQRSSPKNVRIAKIKGAFSERYKKR